MLEQSHIAVAGSIHDYEGCLTFLTEDDIKHLCGQSFDYIIWLRPPSKEIREIVLPYLVCNAGKSGIEYTASILLKNKLVFRR